MISMPIDSIAFANDRQTFEEVPLYDMDRLLNKYLKDQPSRTKVKNELISQIKNVIDYEGTSIEFIEETSHPNGNKYWRVKKSKDPGNPNPFYAAGKVPVEGIVLEMNKHTVRTDAVIMDSLLGHGVALDNYQLGLQEQDLMKKELANRQKKLALRLIAEGDDKKVSNYRSIFCECKNDGSNNN